MNRLSTRLVLSHILVAAVAALTTFFVVRTLAPGLFDQSLMRMQQRGGRGPGGGMGTMGLRDEFARAVDQSMLTGAVVGIAVAAGLGAWAAWRLTRSLGRLREGTRRIAAGEYGVRVPEPAEIELAEVAGDVNTLGEALAETEARRMRLLGEVAHEMRTPLTVIDGYVEGMIDGVLPTDAETLTQLSGETRRLRRLSEDLSALSRAEEGRLALTLERRDLREIVQAAAERLRAQTDDAGLAFSIETGAEPLPVDADVDRIAQLVTNLVGNAIRATPEGGRVAVACVRHHDQAVVSVRDTGEGIDPEHLSQIFERFYREPGRRTSASDSGSGIGLTIARSIARLHRGDLVGASAGKGHGATFTLTLPLASE